MEMYNNTMEMYNSSNLTNSTCTMQPDEAKAWSLLLILVSSAVLNICTIILVTRFKVRRVPDILVIGLAVSDLFAVCIPVSISVFEYFNPCVASGTLCTLFATLAQFSRYSSASIVTVVSVERYFAVNRPFVYRTYIGPLPHRFIIVLVFCWGIAAVLAIVPAVFPGNLTGGICWHEGYCLFYLQSKYAVAVLVYAIIQYIIVCGSFTLVIINLAKVYRRRKRMTSRGTYNQNSQARDRRNEVIFIKPNLTSRISDLGKSIKTGISEKFQLGVEAEFGRMFFLVVVVFYATWSTIVVLIVVAQVNGSQVGLEDLLFWGIRLTVVGTLINPIIYGIFARQYRVGYMYVLRLAFSKVFSCVDPPAKNIFAAADPQAEARRDTRRYDQRLVKTAEPILMRSRATTFTTAPSVKEDMREDMKEDMREDMKEDMRENMKEDVDFLVPTDFLDTLKGDHSMHIAKVGELTSSVVIPHQLQDLEDTPHPTGSPRRSASLDLLAETEPHYLEKISSTNKLALILNDTADSTVLHDDIMESGKIYHNPAYEEGSDRDVTTNPSPSEQGGLTPSETGSTDYLVPRSPILPHSSQEGAHTPTLGSGREGTHPLSHHFEVSSLCTVVAAFKEGGTEMVGVVKSTPSNLTESITSPKESITSPKESITSPTESITSPTESITSPTEAEDPSLSISAQNTAAVLHHNSTMRRESTTREVGSKTVQELKKQFETAKKTQSNLFTFT